MAASTKTDFVEWAEETAELLRERRFDEIDLKNLVGEVEGVARNGRRAVQSQLLRMLMHRIEQRIQPERSGSSWRASIIDARNQSQLDIDDSPGLMRFLERLLGKTYRLAVRSAIDETKLPHSRWPEIPEKCPWTIHELLEGDLE